MRRFVYPDPAIDAIGNIIDVWNPLARFAPGYRVFHTTYGYGVVIKTARTNRGSFVTVHFGPDYVREILAKELTVILVQAQP